MFLVALGGPGGSSCEMADTGLFFVAAGEVLFADVLLLPNGMSKVGIYTRAGAVPG